jgi:Zn-dependent protease with chaperone function
MGVIIYAAFLGVFISKLISTRRLSMFFLKRVKKIIDFIELEPDLIDKNYSEVNIKHLSIKLFIAVIFSVTISGMLIFLQQFVYRHQNSIYFKIMIGLLIFIMFILDPLVENYKKRKQYDESNNDVEVNDSYYLNTELQNDIKNMCDKLNINDIDVTVTDELNINAYAKVTKYTRPKLQITTGLCNSLMNRYPSDPDKYNEMIKFIIGHESIHIKYKDPINIIKRQKVAAACNMGIYIIFILIMFAATKISSFLFLLGIIPFFYLVFFGKTISDIRYWEQMSELRADRYGLKISGVPLDRFITFWTFPERERQEKQQSQFIDSSNIVYKYLIRYVENEAHPSLERRVNAMRRRYPKWGLIDYIQQLFVILYWRFIARRGWNGR